MAAKKKPAARAVKASEPEEPFFPEDHSFIADESLANLIASQREASAGARATEERWSNAVKQAAAQADTNFQGLRIAVNAMGEEISRLTSRNVEQDKKVLQYQEEIHKRNGEISEMVRQSEEARLKREEQAHQLKAKELDLQARAMELSAEKDKFRETLKLISPLVMAGGMGLKDFIEEKMRGNRGNAASGAAPGQGGGGLPGPVPAGNGQAPANGANGAPAPRYRVTLDHIDEWRAFVALAFANIKPETAALLRALVACGLSGPQGPKMPMDDVIAALRADLGDDAMLGFMRLTGEGWAEEIPVPPAQPSAAN